MKRLSRSVLTTLAISFSASLAHATPGAVDPTFGTSGVTTVAIGANSLIYDLAEQSDGKLVAAGARFDSTIFDGAEFALARFDADGALDPSFGTGGIVTTEVGIPTDCCDILETLASAVALQADGRIVAAGHALVGVGPVIQAALVRYLPDGSLDATFGTGGILIEPSFQSFEDVVVQPDGRILAAASYFPYAVAPAGGLVRYESNGLLDATFGAGGFVTTPPLRALLLLPGGSFLAAGGTGGGSSDFWIGRFLPGGSPDPTFGTGGSVATDFAGSEIAQAIALAPTGDIVVGGGALSGDVLDYDELRVARYDSGGNLDPSFDGDGKVQMFLGTPQTLPSVVLHISAAQALLVQGDGSILVGGSLGYDFYGFSVPYAFTLSRLAANGVVDPSFHASPTTSIDTISAMVFQADTVVVAGWKGSYPLGAPLEFGLARHVLEGDLAPSCGDGTLDPGEECDDGNPAPGDGCSATCTIEPPGFVCGDGSLDPDEDCDDGNLSPFDCCSPGCTFESAGTPCGAPEPCFAVPACDGAGACLPGEPAPKTGCKTTLAAGGSRIVLRDSAKARLTWKWRGEETSLAEFGQPENGADYHLCLYAGETATALVAPGGGACAGTPGWQQRSKGPRYRDRDASADGLQSISTRAGTDGKAKVIVRGAGSDLALPVLPSSLPLTVQLQVEAGGCFEAVFDDPEIAKNDAARLQARSVLP